MDDADKKWLQDTIYRIIQDNVYHGIQGLWGPEGRDLEGDDPEHSRRAKMLEEASINIKDTGSL